MEITNKDVKVLGRVVAITTDNVVASAEQVYDESFNGGQHQNVINKHFSDSNTTLDKKIDTLQQYVDDNYVPLDGTIMNENSSLQFIGDFSTTFINEEGLEITSSDNHDITKIQPTDVNFSNSKSNINCGICLRNNDVVVYNKENTLKIKRDQQLCDVSNLTVQAKNFVIPERQEGELIEATGAVAIKITEEQILKLFEE